MLFLLGRVLRLNRAPRSALASYLSFLYHIKAMAGGPGEYEVGQYAVSSQPYMKSPGSATFRDHCKGQSREEEGEEVMGK